MARLTTRARKALPRSDFEATDGSYPDEDRGHAKAALARASEFASPKVKAEVDRNVERKYPSMEEGGEKGAGAKRGRVPRGEHHATNHREPRSHDDFEQLGNPGKGEY